MFRRIVLFTLLLAAGVMAAPITKVPAEGWIDDCYFVATTASRAQVKSFLENLGLNVARVRDLIVGDCECAEDGGLNLCCTRRSFTVIDGYRLIEIDQHVMDRWGDKIVALVNAAPNTYLFTRKETIQRTRGATTVTNEEGNQ